MPVIRNQTDSQRVKDTYLDQAARRAYYPSAVLTLLY